VTRPDFRLFRAAWALGLALSLLHAASCAVYREESPPFVLGKPRCAIGGDQGPFLLAGIEFDFYNLDDREVSGMEVSAMVYERETSENPFIGSNKIRASLEGSVPARAKARLAIPLDEYICAIPGEPYIIDFFYVSRVAYSDGTSWSDPLGTYYTGSE